MKKQDLKTLSKKALIKRLKATERKNWRLSAQLARQNEQIAELLAYNLVCDEIFAKTVQQNLASIAGLQAQLERLGEADNGDQPNDQNVTQ